MILESLAYHRKRDEESNRVSTPPPSERLRWACFWLVDFLTPNVLSQTVEHLRLSPLDRGDGTREPLSSWIGEARALPLFRGQVNLPICARPGAGWLGGIACEDIPEDIDTVSMSVYSLTAGLQVVLAQFYLTTGGQLALREVLAKPRSTEAVEHGGGTVSFVEPFHQKRNDFLLLRQVVHSGAWQWLGTHIPGVFALEAEHGPMPSCDFIVTRSRVPFPKRRDRRLTGRLFDDYMHVAGLSLSLDAWESDALPGFRLGLPDGTKDDSYMLTLAARERDIGDFAQVYQGNLLRRASFGLQDTIDGFLITWGLHELAQRYHAQLTEQRDSWNRHAVATAGAADRAKEAASIMGKKWLIRGSSPGT